eukprot:GHVO01012730.1.p1 GENE.GHVO01012730.1~~GHVO01012730.1.p1  ORF type:complete len:249 (+),score=39.81 GHVO01012730.1:693-1439(+)
MRWLCPAISVLAFASANVLEMLMGTEVTTKKPLRSSFGPRSNWYTDTPVATKEFWDHVVGIAESAGISMNVADKTSAERILDTITILKKCPLPHTGLAAAILSQAFEVAKMDDKDRAKDNEANRPVYTGNRNLLGNWYDDLGKVRVAVRATNKDKTSFKTTELGQAAQQVMKEAHHRLVNGAPLPEDQNRLSYGLVEEKPRWNAEQEGEYKKGSEWEVELPKRGGGYINKAMQVLPLVRHLPIIRDII